MTESTTDIARLFQTDPLEHTTKDIKAIIAVFREARKSFDSGVMDAGATKKLTSAQKEASDAAGKLDISVLLD